MNFSSPAKLLDQIRACARRPKTFRSTRTQLCHSLRALAFALVLFALCLRPSLSASIYTAPPFAPQAQSPQNSSPQSSSASAQSSSAPTTSALKIRAWPRVGGEIRRLDRKRFFLIRGGLEQNRALVERINALPLLSRDCYYRAIGASDALIKWLDRGDCESIYCREVTMEDLSGGDAVPEFQQAYARGQKEFGRADVALRWLTVNLRAELRDGFYKRQHEALRALLGEAESLSQTKVQSVMTDRKGSAYFTNIEPGTYVVSNLLPTEVGGVALLWNCEVEIKPRELAVAMKRPFMLTNDASASRKCFVEKPLPSCPSSSK